MKNQEKREVTIPEDEYILLVAIWEHASGMFCCDSYPEFAKEHRTSCQREMLKLKELIREYEEMKPREYPS